EDENTLRALQEEVVFLVNAAVVGFGGSVRDVDHVISITERVRDTLSLGLEVRLRAAGLLDASDESRLFEARRIVLQTRLESVFRSGHFEVEQLARRARALAEDPVVAHWLARDDADGDEYRPERADQAFMRALIAFPATFAGFDLTRPDRTGSIHSLAQLGELRSRVETLAAQIR
ncbi:MAG: DUF6178 family protein, partial [Myxococcota bacterium]